MKLKFYTLICISFLFLFAACEQEDDPIPAEKVSRTVLVYIMADNTLSNFASTDINEMMKGMKSVDASLYNLLVYVDDNSSPGSSYYSAPTLYRLSKDKKGNVQKEVVKEYKEQISTDSSVFQEVLTRAYTQYPAESYGLVLWSHGEGWIPSPLPAKKSTSTRWIGQDSTDGDNYLNIADMASVLSKLPHFEFILFDACFGQAIEVAYELRQYADYIIGSPTEIPGPGAPYDEVVPAMFKATNVGVETIAEAYYKPYDDIYDGELPTNDKWTGGVSVSVIKCAALDELASITKQTLKTVELNTLLNSGLYNYDKRSKYSTSFVGYYDMKQLMQLLSDDINAWTSAANNAIIYWKTTPKNYSGIAKTMFSIPQETTCGFSHYIPMSLSSSAAAAYRSTAWYSAAGLDQIGW